MYNIFLDVSMSPQNDLFLFQTHLFTCITAFGAALMVDAHKTGLIFHGWSILKKLLTTTAVVSVIAGSVAQAEPSLLLGFALNFGGGESPSVGVTSKILSDNREDRFVGAAGVTYFLDDGGYFGADLGIGRTFKNSAATLSYDFLNNRPQISAGWAKTREVC